MARRAVILALALVLACACLACSRPHDDIAVGAYLSLSGVDSTFGTDTRDGIELAVQEVNAAGGVKGKKVRVLYEDDKSTASEATNKVRQLIDRDGVVALLGEVASSRSVAGGLIANAKHVPMVTPSSTAVEVTRDRDFVFRACFTNAQQGDVAAQFVHDKQKKTRAAIFYVAQDNYSTGLAQIFKESFTRLGGTIVLEKGYPAKETNFTTFLEALKAAKPEAIFVPVYYNDMVQIARQAKNVGLPGSIFVGGDGWDSEDLLRGAGSELEGAFFMNAYAADVPWESSQSFLRHFKERYGHAPGSIAAQGYDGARLLFDAIGRATETTPEAIKVVLAQTTDFQGATGRLTIDKNHDANKPVVIVQVKNKQFTYFDQIASQSPEGTPPNLSDAGSPPVTLAKIGDALLTGLAQGSMIALVALGYTLVYGVLKLINFAHSEVFMMAAYAGLFAISALAGAGPVLAALGGTAVAMIGAALLGVLVERAAYRPLRGRGKGPLSRVTPLVTALGASVLLQNVAQLLFTARYRPYPRLFEQTRPVIFVAAVAVMALLEIVVKKTWFGKAMRALATNEEAARLMGIRTSRVVAQTFALGSALAAVGAVLYCLDQSLVYPTMGVTVGTRAFVAAVLGGIGSIPGAMLGGLLLGVLGELVKLSDYSGGVDVLVFLVLIAVLLARPAGLLGARRAEKV